MARAVSRRAGTPSGDAAMTGSSGCAMAWRSSGRLVRAKARSVADSSSNSDLCVERHTADQRGVISSGRYERPSGFSLLILSNQNKFSGLHKIAGLQAIEINSARHAFGIPHHLMRSGCKILLHQRRDFFSQSIVHFQHDIIRAR